VNPGELLLTVLAWAGATVAVLIIVGVVATFAGAIWYGLRAGIRKSKEEAPPQVIIGSSLKAQQREELAKRYRDGRP
jgi:hypothetical protein